MTAKAGGRPAQPRFFRSPAVCHAWLARYHRTRRELHVGFHKRRTGKPSLPWPEAVDEALCFGIDGVRRRLDDERYTVRFTRRKRLASLIAHSARERPIPPLTRERSR